jgi:hypothetical protein
MMLALLVLSAAPQLVVTPTEILLDGKVVASPNDAPEFLNLPQLQERLHSLPEPAEIHFAPDVTFRIAKRVLYSAARGTATSPSFFVADRGPSAGAPSSKSGRTCSSLPQRNPKRPWSECAPPTRASASPS